MDIKAANDGTFLSVSYDMAKQMELQKALGDLAPIDGGRQQSAAYEYTKTLRDSYMQALGRSRMEMRFTPAGLQIDTSVTFK
jgi:hypothetical protein